MLTHIAPLLTHYSNRINISVTSHPKGMQVTLAVMPCPLKVKDEAMRQQLIQPIVVVGDETKILEQLSGLEETLNAAINNDPLNASVTAFNDAVGSATNKQGANATTQPAATAKATATNDKAPTASTVPDNNPLADFLA